MLPAQNYVWPTDASKYLTSAFAEFRPRHYHAALDIKTWNRTGYRVFAIDDGYIFRVRVGSFGYGRAIYLKLRDGRIVVYGHLQRFIRKLQNYTDSLRLARQKYVLDQYLKPGQFPVRRGQLIAFSGETGIGVPHLHFEMRDAKNRPINPLKFYRERLRDTIPPALSRLAVIPLSAKTFINFEPDTLLLDIPRQKKAVLTDPVYLTGKAYLALKASDRADGVNNRFGIYEFEMFVNDSLVYTARFDRFSYAQNPLIELDKNFSLKRRGSGVFQNLYRMPANGLEFYGNTAVGGGALTANNLKYGRNQLRIRAADYFGNSSELSLAVIYYPEETVQTYGLTRLGKRILFNVKSRNPLHHIDLSFQRAGETAWISGMPYELRDMKKVFTEYHYFLSAGNDSLGKISRLMITPFISEKVPLVPRILELQKAANQSDPAVPPHAHFFGSRVGLLLPADYPEMKNMPGIERYHLKSGREYDLLPQNWQSSLERVKKFRGKPLLSFLSRWKMIRPGVRAVLASEDTVLQISFSPNSVYDTLYSAIFTRSFSNTPETGKSLLPVYDVRPFDRPLRNGATLRLTLPDRLKARPGLGVYYLDQKKGWLFLPTRIDSANHTFQTRVLSLEKFTLFQDTVPPEIHLLNRMPGKTLRPGNKSIRFKVEDKVSGIMKERQITVRIDGKWSLFEYDPEEDEVSIWPSYLPRGSHVIEIQAADNVGNTAYFKKSYIK